MKTTHTPGPWHLGMQPGPIVYGPNGEQVADLRKGMLHRDEDVANIRLIAAAPDLLAALEAFNAWRNEHGYGSPELEAVVCQSLNAIAKARGEA